VVSEGWASADRAGFNNLDREYFQAVTSAYDEVVGGRRYAYSRTIKSGNLLYEVDVQGMTAFAASPIAEMVGVRSAAKRVPVFVWSASPAFKVAFLRAIFEGDGSSSLLRPAGGPAIQVSYSTRSLRLADAVPFVAEYVRGERMARRTDREWLQKHNIDRIERWERDRDEIVAHLTNDEVRRVIEPLVDGTYYYATVAQVEDAGPQAVYSL